MCICREKKEASSRMLNFFVKVVLCKPSHVLMFSDSNLYCFRCFRRCGQRPSCALPIIRATDMKTCRSATHAHAKPPNARMIMKSLKLSAMSVSCMKLASDLAGSSNKYVENRRATTSVTTNGTADILTHAEGQFHWYLTVICHRLSEWMANAQHNGGRDILETG